MQNDCTLITYIARPQDYRCKWWSVILPQKLDPEKHIGVTYLKRGQDLELALGTMILDSESIRHRQNRGYSVTLGVVFPDGVRWIKPSLARKQYIKRNGGGDLMRGSGDIAGVVRMAMWLRRQENLETAFFNLMDAKGGQ